MNDFYVYAWRRPDTGAVFYIGKGRGRRDVSLKRYNPHFMNLVAKLERGGLSPTVDRIHVNLSESEAFRIEREEIAAYGRAALTNLTDGGEGSSGAVVSEETRAKKSASLKGIPRTPEWLGRMSEGLMGNQNARGAIRSDETRAKMSVAQSKKTISADTRKKISATVTTIVRKASPRSDNSSGYKGVAFCARGNKWQAGISVKGKRKALGRFSTKEQAAKAYDSAARELWGFDCYQNFPVAANDNKKGASIAS